MVGQRIQNADARKDTMEFINGKEVRVKETANHGVESKPFSLCALMSVDMFYTLQNKSKLGRSVVFCRKSCPDE